MTASGPSDLRLRRLALAMISCLADPEAALTGFFGGLRTLDLNRQLHPHSRLGWEGHQRCYELGHTRPAAQGSLANRRLTGVAEGAGMEDDGRYRR